MRTWSSSLLLAGGAAVFAAAPSPALDGDGGGAAMLVGLEPAGTATNVHLVTKLPFAGSHVFTLPVKLSSMSRLPGTFLWSFTGGWNDGGHLYHLLPNGVFVLAGPTGYGAMPALAWNATGTVLWGATGSSLGSQLVSVDPFTGQATPVGPTGAAGIEALATHPPTGVLYATTGYHYDGSPGDILSIDTATGAATDTGIDLKDAAGTPPPCSVTGLAFSLDGQEGYASVGCGAFGLGAGTLYRFDASFVLTPIGPGTAAGAGGSMSAVEGLF